MASTHFTARRVERARSATSQVDYVLLLAVAALLLIGLMMAYSTTFDWSYSETSNPLSYFIKQTGWVILGLVVMMLVARMDYTWWRRLAVPIMAGAVLSLLLVLIFGSKIFGAQRSFLNGSIQPSEPAKLAIIIYVAAWLSSKGAKIRRITYGLIPFSVLIGFIASLIVLQPDFSTAILIVMTAGTMFFIAGADLLQVVLACVVGSGTFFLLITNSAHAGERLRTYVAGLSDPTALSEHVDRALVALGSGGLFGRGLGAGLQKFGWLPAPHTDSVFAVLGEELGLIGSLIVVALFALLAQRGFKIALESRDSFGAVLAAGLTCWLIFQAVINVGVMTAIIPFTGIPLPFLSVGGSAMVSCLGAVGLLLSISRGSQRVVTSHKGSEPTTASSQMRQAQFSFDVRRGGRNHAGSVLWRRNRRSRVSRTDRRW
jgi:cell division protein FtsW